ncbi:DinB family protein [Frigidibacter sp. ROC022]|uniref:DinB family protein n=1 Tax=Frigidibacter sp. ROC022 TaxID=2971796 RepID=UPI00215A43E5|nr:DinB family protein [Frigidibacter sp. ROC022]MCR8725609.1 DinB family protein [Frigidibacter sp. ROC022]
MTALVTPDYARLMARYNAWQNRSLYREADKLTDAQRREDRGAFFGSVQRTLCHILTIDHVWMSRFDGWEMPAARGAQSPDWYPDWEPLCAARVETDARLIAWADGLTESALEGDLTWQSGLAGGTQTKPLALLVAHMFNHQTHHRGQVHALLTGFGCRPDDTDLGFMPADA